MCDHQWSVSIEHDSRQAVTVRGGKDMRPPLFVCRIDHAQHTQCCIAVSSKRCV